MSKYERNLMIKEQKDGTRIFYRENSSDLYAYLENQYKLPNLTREDVMMDWTLFLNQSMMISYANKNYHKSPIHSENVQMYGWL